jgi:hypothetical protein
MTITCSKQTIQTNKDFITPSSTAIDGKEKFYDATDTNLAIANALRLGMDYAFDYVIWNSLKSPVFLMPFAVLAQVYQSHTVFQAMKQPTSKIGKILSTPLLGLVGLITQNPALIAVHSVAKAVGLMRNSVPKLFTSLKNITKHPFEALSATLLHVFNIGSQGYFAKKDIELYVDRPDIGAAAGTRAKPLDEKLSDMDRLTAEGLDPNNPFDAAQAMKVEARTTCEAIKKAFRKLSQVHPDKHPGNPKAKEAFNNLVNFRDTLNRFNGCSAK